MDDLEADWNEARKKKGSYILPQLIQHAHIQCFFLKKDTPGDEPEDLLFANPNHGIIPDNNSEHDEFDQPKPLGSDSTSELNEASHFAVTVK